MVSIVACCCRLGSYNEFNHKLYRDAAIITLVDTFTSLLAGFTIFAVLGNLSLELGVDIDKVSTAEMGLAFETYPLAIAKFGWAPQVRIFLNCQGISKAWTSHSISGGSWLEVFIMLCVGFCSAIFSDAVHPWNWKLHF